MSWMASLRSWHDAAVGDRGWKAETEVEGQFKLPSPAAWKSKEETLKKKKTKSQTKKSMLQESKEGEEAKHVPWTGLSSSMWTEQEHKFQLEWPPLRSFLYKKPYRGLV